MKTLGDGGEFGFIRRIRDLAKTSDSVEEGIGDDCAVLKLGNRRLLVSCDASLEDVHFRRSWPPHAIGYKAAASALSDIAAMGGHALWMLVTVAVPPIFDAAALDEIMEGIQDAGADAGAVLAGGDTCHSRSGLMLDITVMGEPHTERCLLRRGAQTDDLIVVTGYPGVGAAGFHALEQGQRAGTLVDRYLYPRPRLAEGRWLAEHDGVHALIDVSDGVVQDSGHIGTASGVGIALSSAGLPLDEVLLRYALSVSEDATKWCLSGGEDYELLGAVSPENFSGLQRAFQREFHLPLSAIGVCTAEPGPVLVDGRAPAHGGYDHFRLQEPGAT